MKKHPTLHRTNIVYLALFVLLSVFLYCGLSHAKTISLAGTQLAYFVGYHSGGIHKGYSNDAYYKPRTVYYSPRYHHKGAYRTPWTSIGHNCRKTCWLDRWTGRALRCYRTC
jgi:hypothetical protein